MDRHFGFDTIFFLHRNAPATNPELDTSTTPIRLRCVYYLCERCEAVTLAPLFASPSM